MAEIIKPVNIDGTAATTEPPFVENKELSSMSLARTIPRQVSTGDMRGLQTITGELRVADPNGSAPVVSISGTNLSAPISNVKIPIVLGKLESGNYGIAISDGSITFITITKDGILMNDGVTDRILIGKQDGGF